MSRLSKLMAKPQEVSIEGETFLFKPLRMKDLELLMAIDSKDPAQQAAAFRKVVNVTLKESVPDATDEELESISIQHFQALSEAVMKVNGLDNAIKG